MSVKVWFCFYWNSSNVSHSFNRRRIKLCSYGNFVESEEHLLFAKLFSKALRAVKLQHLNNKNLQIMI